MALKSLITLSYMRHVRGFVVCNMCGMCELCEFECQSVVNSNTRGHSAGVTMSFVQMSPRLLQMLIVFHGGSVPNFDVVSFGFCFFVVLFLQCWCRSHCCCSCHVGLKPTAFATEPKLRMMSLHVLRQSHRLLFVNGQVINVTAITVVPVFTVTW